VEQQHRVRYPRRGSSLDSATTAGQRHDAVVLERNGRHPHRAHRPRRAARGRPGRLLRRAALRRRFRGGPAKHRAAIGQIPAEGSPEPVHRQQHRGRVQHPGGQPRVVQGHGASMAPRIRSASSRSAASRLAGGPADGDLPRLIHQPTDGVRQTSCLGRPALGSGGRLPIRADHPQQKPQRPRLC
jgi:hypothetical protein